MRGMFMNLEAVLEGLLFVVGDDGLTLQQIEEILEISTDDAKNLITGLREKMSHDDRGIRITFLGDCFKLATKEEHRKYYEKLVQNPYSNSLSEPALEVLAIVAYNEPITRVKVDEIRGVSSSQMMRKLVAKGFLKEIGKSDLPGRPILYKTTHEFLDYFNLATIDDLPQIKEVPIKAKDQEEIDLYLSKYEDNAEIMK